MRWPLITFFQCMLNGRTNGKNDFTHVSHRGKSVVDYVLVPHEQFCDIKLMNSYRMTEIIELFKLNGCEKLPDHSLLLWEINIVKDNSNDASGNYSSSKRKCYNVSNIPTDFLNNRDAAVMIQRTIERIDQNLSEERGANEAYSAFLDLLNSEMNAKLTCFKQTDVNFKGRRMKCKKYWNNNLQIQWNKVCEKEKLWLKCRNNNTRNVLKADYCAERRLFDKMNRRCKRQHQRTEQEKLQGLLHNDGAPRDFWREIGKLSLANERKSKIPMEVVDADGSSIFDSDRVLEKWKTDYSNLLNSESSGNFDNEHYESILRQYYKVSHC